MPVVAAVGTTHPLAFAGVTFAMQVLAREGVRPVCVIAGVSAQDARSVLRRTPLDAATIAAQFDALREAGVGAFHVGALLSTDAVRAVAAGLAAFAGVPVVVDPVLAATGGDPLADDATVAALRDVLLPCATLLTPNLDEAGALLERSVRDLDAMRDAAPALRARGARAVLVKGGHLAGDAIDVVSDDAGVRTFRTPRIANVLRGTGDLLAATIAASLASGATLDDAIVHAHTRVADAIAHGVLFAGTRVAPETR
ncbi:hydroxymethylpyrimidine/phosphomethylpyrimidine kinase [Vulcanimicrobium alpinum]|uniref:Hydroxymethylpyrimidine/phosphomethylpyrimidine kinase n=1 Tax=Vulcanimicrobium alpinum TaxID=3016050 RepID=A0AAN1Y097_UNVUL|nr:PfkB family carbohydrate kinase [Vulcanimicrobium alpinum]BDE08226.1 hydroxymethylpyrimidine/phosphomethylpyrimidine kinase [Vulcanimicrobium alpinum]